MEKDMRKQLKLVRPCLRRRLRNIVWQICGVRVLGPMKRWLQAWVLHQVTNPLKIKTYLRQSRPIHNPCHQNEVPRQSNFTPGRVRVIKFMPTKNARIKGVRPMRFRCSVQHLQGSRRHSPWFRDGKATWPLQCWSPLL